MKRISLILVLVGVFGAASVWAGESLFVGGTLQNALEYNRTNQVSTWVNPDTGQSGSMVPTRTFQNAVGQPCREFTQSILIAGEEQHGYGTACRQPDGSWQIVSDQRAATQIQAGQPSVIYVREAAVRYVPYPYAYRPYYRYGYAPYYFPYNLSLSFGYVYRSGHDGGGHHRWGRHGGWHRGGSHYGGGWHRGGHGHRR